MSKHLLEWGSAKAEVVRGTPQTAARGKTYVEKMQKQIREII